MTEPDRAESTTVAQHPPAPQGRHRAARQPVPAPPAPAWLPRTALGAAMALALGVGILATTSAAGDPSRPGAPAATTTTAADAAAGLARLSLGAPQGAKLMPAQPVSVARPATATPATITGLAANGIPAVALNAYRLAAARLASAQPSCGVEWWLLAGIGRVESDHGRYGGASLSPSGESSPHIIGPALDGIANDYIADTDGGRLDGDLRFDHAVGPMQFIPWTWAVYGIDGNGDRVASPFNINDAALAAARYLCAAGGDVRTAAGQRRAVLAYNHSDEYLALVLGTAAAYASGLPLNEPITGITTGGLPAVDTSWLPPVNPGRPAGLGPSAGGLASSSGTGSSGTGSSGTGSSGTGSASTGSAGGAPAGSGSSGSGPSGARSAGGTGQPAPSSAAPASSGPRSSTSAKPSSPATSSSPAPSGLPLPTLSIPAVFPTPTGSTVCTKTVLGIVLPVPCTSS